MEVVESKPQLDKGHEFAPLIQLIKRTDIGSSRASEPRKREATDEPKAKREKKDLDETSIKWTRLEHNGVWFPPEYVPHHVRLKYNGQEVVLSAEAEEVATFFAGVVGTEYETNPVFRKNFFRDFREILKRDGTDRIVQQMDKCDFSDIVNYLNGLKDMRKNRSKEDKLREKEEKERQVEQYGFCKLDGQMEKVGNFRIEPPGLFRGRGKHPKTGCWKKRVRPEQVTLNLGKTAPVPPPPPGTRWGNIVHDNTVTWLASWVENVNGETKYVFLAAGSKLKVESDLKKFEKARELKDVVDKIRKINRKELKDKAMGIRQRATALWFIDNLALRTGNEKGDDEADTVGCCSLRAEHVKLEPPDIIVFDFLGKDSIRYYNRVSIPKGIFGNMKRFLKSKSKGDPVFDQLSTSSLNGYLNKLSPGLTAKVFRTFNASFTFQKELKGTPTEGTLPEKILAYNRANRQVAILCNHQRSIPKTHGTAMERLRDKVRDLKYDLQLVKNELQGRQGFGEEYESDIDAEFMQTKAVERQARETEKNILLVEQGKKPRAQSRVEDLSTEKLEKHRAQLQNRILQLKTLAIDRDEGKQTALGTSKINYIDPRISVAWCRTHNIPVEKIFNKSLREKFRWATEVGPNWKF